MAASRSFNRVSPMGSGDSKSQKSPSVSHVSLTSTTGGEDGDYPFVQRSLATGQLLDHLIEAGDVTKSLEPETWQENFVLHLNTVKEVFLIDKCIQINEQQSILVDKLSCDLVVLIEKLGVEQPDGWQPECESLCRVLCSHVSASQLTGKIPDTKVTNLVQLNLANVRVKSQQGLSGLMTLLQKNKGLEMVEFGFTGMKTDLFQKVFSHIVKLQKLTYLGLRGNRLDNSAVSTVQKSIQSTKTLPRLMWVDFANNMDIISLPLTFLTLLKQRWPSEQYHPTYRELLDSKIVVHKSQFVLMI